MNADQQDQLRQSQLSKALSALEVPQDALHLGASDLGASDLDARAARQLERLTDLRAQLRAKAWAQAQRLADALGADTLDPLPDLSAEVAQLTASGRQLERGEAQRALELLAGVRLPLLRAETETQRGTALVFLGDTEAAVRAFKEAVSLDPRHYRALTNLGNVALEQGETDEAITHYEAALKLNENFANAHHNLGVAYRRKGEINKSVAAIRRAQRVSKQHDREEARAVLKTFGGAQRGKSLRWLLYALAAAGVFLLLRAQGVF